MQNTLPILQQDTISAGSSNCLPVGTRLADFEITGIVGEGGFGIVYLAFDHSLQRTVAIKEYMPAMFASRGSDKSVMVRSSRDKDTFATGLKSFINEARMLAQFDHPALIKVYRFWEESNTGYMAMRYYEGQTLKNIIKKDPARITEEWLKSILKPILEALDTLYRVNILHRDISPENIMIQKSGEPVLLDFGAARQIIGDMAHSFTVILKPGYAPIEQYADESGMKQGPWTDIYSLSAVIYSAIAKKLPPTSVARIIKDPVKLLQEGDYPGFSKEFLAAIDKGLAVKPEERPQSIDEFRKLLKLELAVPIPMPRPASGASAQILGSIRTEPDRMNRFNGASSTRSPKSTQQRTKAAARFNKSANVLLSLSVAGIVGGVGTVGYVLFKQKTPVVIAKQTTESVSQLSKANSGLSLPTTGQESHAPAAAVAFSAEKLLKEERAAWNALKGNPDPALEDVASFIQKYPQGQHTKAALARMAEIRSKEPGALEAKKEAAASASKSAALKPEKISNGLVRLNVKPWATILVNGISKGVSPPLKQLALPEGKHYIKLENPNYSGHIIEIDVKKKKAVTVEYDFSANKK